MNKWWFLLLMIAAVSMSCEEELVIEIEENGEKIARNSEVRATDLSAWPQIRSKNLTFYDSDGNEASFLPLIRAKEINTVRLKLWVNPDSTFGTLDEVANFSEELRNMGFDIWLTLHYSDTWADPGQQRIPRQWSELSFQVLLDSTYAYTKRVVSWINPDFIQIGNEINSGLMHPQGHIHNNGEQFLRLLEEGARAVREHSSSTKIILHYAGLSGSQEFFEKVISVDYDIIGLSYYPMWHDKNLAELESTLQDLSSRYSQEVLIAETAYPFTLGWNDWTNNIVGLEEHLIPGYPATPDGQKSFMMRIREAAVRSTGCLGYCYWGGELIAFDGAESSHGSPWENQALFDFERKALPVLEVFKQHD